MKKLLAPSELGFTLIELIVAITIIIILTTLSFASFNSSGLNLDSKDQVQEVKTLARKLHTDAIASRTSCNTGYSFYGTYVDFVKSSPLPSPPQTQMFSGTGCYNSSGQPQTSPSVQDTTTYKTGVTVTNLISLPSKSSVGTELIVFFLSTGNTVFFNNGLSGHQVSSGADLDASLSSNPNFTDQLDPAANSGVAVDFTGKNSSYRLNFMSSGLICEDKLPLSGTSCTGL